MKLFCCEANVLATLYRQLCPGLERCDYKTTLGVDNGQLVSSSVIERGYGVDSNRLDLVQTKLFLIFVG